MKAHLSYVSLLLLVFTTITSEARTLTDYPSNNPPASLSLQDLNGHTHKLKNYKGEVVLINFWGSWCPPCVEELPSLQRLENKLKYLGFTVLAVNVNQTRTSVSRFLKGLQIDLTVLMDTSVKAAKAWGVDYYPTSFMVDKKGDIRFYVVGPIDWEQEEVVAQIRKLLNE